jgi:hypothetical protein
MNISQTKRKKKKMEFEFIDESEIEYSSTPRKKKTPSLFDSKIEDRTYWGNDPGTELVMALARIQIRKSIKNLRLMNVDTEDMTSVLSKEYRDELRMYQLEILNVLITQDKYIIVQDSRGEMLLELVQPLELVEESI